MLDELAHAGPEHLDEEFIDVSYKGRLYGAYTCVKSGDGQGDPG